MGAKQGVFTDTTSTVQIDWSESNNCQIDSVFYSCNGQHETFSGMKDFSFRPAIPGPQHLHAKIFSNGHTQTIDTSFEAVKIPDVSLHYIRKRDSLGNDIIHLYLLDENNCSTGKRFSFCYVNMVVDDSVGNIKYDGGCPKQINLTKWSETKIVELNPGDRIEFNYIRLLYHEINQSFFIRPNLILTY